MALLLSLIFFVSALIFFLKLYGKRAKESNLPPSPPKLPIIGHFHQLGDLPHCSLRSLAEKHGSLMLLQLGQVPTLVVSSAEMAEEVMKTHDLVFATRPSLTAPGRIMYGSSDIAYSPYGEYWRQLRKICVLELLSIKRVNSFRSFREEEVGLMIERISQSCPKGEAANLRKLLLSFASGTITRVAFGKKYEGEEGKESTKFAELGAEAMRLLGGFLVGDYFPSLGWVDVVTGMDAKLKKNFCEINAILDQVIDDHLKHREVKSCDGVEQKDLVDVLLDIQKDSVLGVNLTRDNLKGVILDMFVGGMDTTALILEWTMSELMRHPDVMEKAQAEIRGVVGKNGKVKEEDLHQLHYLKLIIKENLRLHPTAPLLVPREARADVVVHGYHIPAKTRVFVNAWAIARDPKTWKNAEAFLPERFANISIDFTGQDFELIPFGAGRRGCPGMWFGLNSVELALANLLYCFDWELPQGLSKEDIDMSEVFGLTVHRKIPLHLVPRKHFS